LAGKRIVTNRNVLGGKPILEGTRISVAFLLQLLAAGMNVGQIVDEYPGVQPDDVLAAVDYARQVVEGEEVMPAVEGV
jgi:uncharacterized protein (DUF433 family)